MHVPQQRGRAQSTAVVVLKTLDLQGTPLAFLGPDGPEVGFKPQFSENGAEHNILKPLAETVGRSRHRRPCLRGVQHLAVCTARNIESLNRD